ncbi:hypothetical protein ACIRRH_34345 [Kitasatospora sp. NPDC101235]
MDLRGGPVRRLRLGALTEVFTPELVDAATVALIESAVPPR